MPTLDQPLLREVIDLDSRSIRGIDCRTCHQKSFPESDLCSLCGSDEVDPVPLAPTGSVVSWTVVHQAPSHLPTPYTLATVDLDSGVRMLGYVDDDVDIGDPVRIEVFPYRTGDNGETLWWYRFRTSEDGK